MDHRAGGALCRPPACDWCHRPVSQRWCERPRCRALRVAPALGDGVVHAIAGRAACHCLCSRFRQEETRRRVSCAWSGLLRTSNQRHSRARPVPLSVSGGGCLVGKRAAFLVTDVRAGRGPDCPDDVVTCVREILVTERDSSGVTFHVSRRSRSESCECRVPRPLATARRRR